ncbi:MAG: hypothetical protein WEB52_09885 [Dehalococcoidia bacterium]
MTDRGAQGAPPIDNGEEAGLRAFAVEVGAYAGASYPERPEWVLREGQRLSVEEVLAAWREEERIGFRVRLQDGSLLLLYYVPELDLWSGIPFAPAPHRAARRKDRA